LASSQGFLIQLISSSIEILNGTVVYDEYYFLDAFVSTVTMRDIIISDWRFDTDGVQITSSTFLLEGAELWNITTDPRGHETAIFKTSLDSDFYISDIFLRDSRAQPFVLQSSSGTINDFKIHKINNYKAFTKIYDWKNLIFTNWDFFDVNTVTGYSFIITDTTFDLIQNIRWNYNRDSK